MKLYESSTCSHCFTFQNQDKSNIRELINYNVPKILLISVMVKVLSNSVCFKLQYAYIVIEITFIDRQISSMIYKRFRQQ